MCDAYHGVCVHLLVHMSMVRSEEEWCMWCWVTIVVLVLWSTLSIGRLLTSSVCYFIIGPPIFDKKYLRIYLCYFKILKQGLLYFYILT